jgi:sarcosine oxidase
MLYDAVVVGLGGVGSFALRALTKEAKGGRFLGIERHVRGHAYGSSHGKSRIYRRAYFEHTSYVPWIEYSLQVLRDLEKSQNVSLMQECGTLIVEATTNGSSLGRLPPLCHRSYQSAQQHDIPVEFLKPADLHERYPQFPCHHDHEMVGLLEPGGGFLRPERVMEAALKDAEMSCDNDVHVVENTVMKSFTNIPSDTGGPDLIELRMARDSGEEDMVVTRSLLIAMGGWTGQIIPSWSPYLEPTRQIQAWIDTSKSEDESLYSYHKFPTWCYSTPDWPLMLYGVPCDSDDPIYSHWLKVGIHGRPILIDDLATYRTKMTIPEVEEMQLAAAMSLDGRAWHESTSNSKSTTLPDFIETKPCIYTMTPDSHFMIGTPQDSESVFCVAGLSGHGFKMTPTLGQMMADFALGKDLQPWQLDFCSPRRFGV